MSEGKTQVATKIRSGAKAENIAKGFPLPLVHIKGKESSGFGEIDFLPEQQAKLLNSFPHATTILLICSLKQKQVISKEQMRKGWIIRRGFKGNPSLLGAFILYDSA